MTKSQGSTRWQVAFEGDRFGIIRFPRVLSKASSISRRRQVSSREPGAGSKEKAVGAQLERSRSRQSRRRTPSARRRTLRAVRVIASNCQTANESSFKRRVTRARSSFWLPPRRISDSTLCSPLSTFLVRPRRKLGLTLYFWRRNRWRRKLPHAVCLRRNRRGGWPHTRSCEVQPIRRAGSNSTKNAILCGSRLAAWTCE